MLALVKSSGWVLCVGVLLFAAACGDGGAEEGTDTVPSRQIAVETKRDLTFGPVAFDVEPGETVEFVITDTSGFFHTFSIATSAAKQTVLADVRVNGNETKRVTITFPEGAIELYLFCRPHESAGMTGRIRVG